MKTPAVSACYRRQRLFCGMGVLVAGAVIAGCGGAQEPKKQNCQEDFDRLVETDPDNQTR